MRISNRVLVVVMFLSATETLVAVDRTPGPRDLALTYHSDIDDTDQPYRLYLPSAYDGKSRLALLIALHGTGGDQNKYFDHEAYGNGIYKREVEKRGIAIVCPHGRGTTEYRGLGENDVLNVVEEVCKRFLIDRDRIVCSGQSMGGTGTTYLCCRYPDVFAAGIPLASTYGHLTLIENLRHVPMFYVQGAKDWPVYAHDGPIPIVKRLKELGYEHQLWMIPKLGHNTMTVSTPRVLDWALEQRRVLHPARVTHRAYLPIHGRAYWTEIAELEEIGPFAEIDATVGPDNVIQVKLRNTRQFILRPDAELLDLGRGIRVLASETTLFEGRCTVNEQIRFDRRGGEWVATVEPRRLRPYTAYRTHKIGQVENPPSPAGRAETRLGSWVTDMIRDATGAHIAIATGRHYRGVPLKQGQDVYLVDLLNLLRPSNRILVRFQMDGRGLLEILEDNIRQKKSYDGQFLVQVSGCSYSFDRSRDFGQRIVESNIVPDRQYTIVCYHNLLSRGDMLHLAGRYGKIPYEELEITNITAAWRYIAKNDGILDAELDDRVRDVTPANQE